MDAAGEIRSALILKAENRDHSGKKYTEYIIDVVTSSGYDYTIARRFSEFHSLYELLFHNFQIQFTFPPKKLNKLNGNLIEMRKKELENFLKFVINHPTSAIRKSNDLVRFLDQNNASFSNKLVKQRITFEDLSNKKKGLTMEITIVEGKDIKLSGKSMWDIVPFCIYEYGKEPDLKTIKSQNMTSIIVNPYPQWAFKGRISIDKKTISDKKIYFKVYNSLKVEQSLLLTETNSESIDKNTNNSSSSINSGSSSNHNSSNSIKPIPDNIQSSELIGTCSIDMSNSNISNQSPSFFTLKLSPEGSGEILVSLILIK
ncbi:hypothetical protein CYY_007130 [Polysphondylium violaceum]|uniref:PX domain-containing protein n=1 Tax=Polysphondylium violaceum TaxID=133409 RepID=A0A8J4PQ50_9MYCE|nr:hypothetical protein CYY_007130 [Polysphondylium violaceum]